MSRPKLLITARDPATAESVRVLVSAAITDGRFGIHVLAQNPAYEILRQETKRLPEELFHFVSQQAAGDLVAFARGFVELLKPDVILTGISGPDAGIDEATLTAVPQIGNGPYALQSYWGDVNISLPGRPRTIFVLDEFAAKITNQRLDVRPVPVGSLKHQHYEDLNIEKLRSQCRSALCVSKDEVVFGFFGQPLHQTVGYRRTVECLVSSIKKIASNWTIIYRPHAKESAPMRHWVKSVFAPITKRFKVDKDSSLERTLAGCDVVASAWSTCGYDLQQLIRVSSKPFATPLYLMFDADLVTWFVNYTGLHSVPLSDNEMGIEVRRLDALDLSLKNAISTHTKKRCFHAIHSQFQNPTGTASRILDHLFHDWCTVSQP